jgi:hypothetical protein
MTKDEVKELLNNLIDEIFDSHSKTVEIYEASIKTLDTENANIIKKYEAKIDVINEEHRVAIKKLASDYCERIRFRDSIIKDLENGCNCSVAHATLKADIKDLTKRVSKLEK